MRHANIHIMGILFSNSDSRKFILKLSENMTLEQLLNHILNEHFRDEADLDLYRTSNWEDYLLLLVNGKIAKHNTLLQDGDKVTITPMFSGG